jgi:hypothetical protein
MASCFEGRISEVFENNVLNPNQRKLTDCFNSRMTKQVDVL